MGWGVWSSLETGEFQELLVGETGRRKHDRQSVDGYLLTQRLLGPQASRIFQNWVKRRLPWREIRITGLTAAFTANCLGLQDMKALGQIGAKALKSQDARSQTKKQQQG